MSSSANLRPDVARLFLEPSSIAIVGVSTSTSSAYKAGGRAVLDHLGVYGFRGRVDVIHPTATEVDGRPVTPTLADLPHVPDVVVIAVPARRVLAVLAECKDLGVQQVLILTAGFGDMGPEGHALEAEILAFAREAGIHITGPNSTGLVTVRSGLAMSMTSVLTAGEPIPEGGLAIIAQSGAIGSTVVERARLAGVGISHIVSTGNQRDMDMPDYMSFFARNAEVETVGLYVESIRDGALFSAAVHELEAAGKRVIAYLGGRTAAGEIAASSHTGKIVGRGALELGLLRTLGVTVVDDPDDIWVLGAAAVGTAEFPREWGMVGYSGGMCVLATEQLSLAGVTFPELSKQTLERVREISPEFAHANNPLDVGPGSMPHDFKSYLSAVAADPAVAAVCVPLPMGAAGWNQYSVDYVLEVQAESGKPFVVLWYGGDSLKPFIAQLRSHGVLVAERPSDLGRIVRALVGPEKQIDVAATADGTKVPAFAKPPSLGGADALRLLENAGIAVAAMRSCINDVEEVAKAAAEVGYPVVVKTGDPDVSHRAELGLVKVGLATEQAVTDAVAAMNASTQASGATTTSTWLVQRMVTEGVELVVTVRDADKLGVFATVGLGGVAVEVLRDVESIPLPCEPGELVRALRRLRMADLFFGFRGNDAIDIVWLHKTLHDLADLLRAEDAAEIEVNPALVTARGGTVVDALLTRKG